MDQIGPPSSNTLSGWKDIASHLGKSVRSAQRWETEYGLPVHRIRTPDGGFLIYANPSEIDAWRLALGTRPLDASPGAVDVDDDPAIGNDASAPVPATRALPSARPSWKRWAIAAGALNVVLGATSAWLAWPARLVPARFELHGNAIRAMSASERVVWQHDFGGTVRPSHAMGREQIVETDLDADGMKEVIAIARVNASSPRALTESDRVVAFDRRGRLLWTVQPVYELVDAERTYRGPWVARAMAVHGSRVAVAFSHVAWRPNFAIEIDAAGRARIRYVQGGWIQGLAYWQTPKGLMLALGGETGDLRGAVLALVDANGPGAREPASPERALTCVGCPNEPARELYLFPDNDVGRALFRRWGYVSALRQQGGDLDIRIGVQPDLLGSVAFLTPDRRIREYAQAQTYWEAHRQLFDDRRMDHPADACPERLRPAVIRRWTTETRWTELTVAPRPHVAPP